MHKVFLFLLIIVSIGLVNMSCYAADGREIKSISTAGETVRFLPLPPRKHTKTALALSSRYFSLQKTSRKLMPVALKQSSSAAAGLEKKKELPPTSEENSKLLLYVYDDVR